MAAPGESIRTRCLWGYAIMLCN